MCSGGGGPWPELIKSPRLDNVSVRLIDLFPNLEALAKAKGASDGRLDFSAQPVDATKCDLPGLRTMFGSMHHMTPDLLCGILKSAVDSGNGFAAIEGTWRSPAALVAFSFLQLTELPLRALAAAPSAKRLFFTLLVPLLPFFLALDGFTSMLRTYTEAEFMEIAHKADPEGKFEWRVTQTYLAFLPLTSYVGLPKARLVAGQAGSATPSREKTE